MYLNLFYCNVDYFIYFHIAFFKNIVLEIVFNLSLSNYYICNIHKCANSLIFIIIG